jgi:hypothetical protein
MLSPFQLKAREGRLTASSVACLMTGDSQKIHALWQRLVSNTPDDDLSDVWPVQLGSVTEQLNVDWFERKYGPVSRRGEVVTKDDWMAATLDGWSDQHECPIEAKHVGGRELRETIIDRYQPQMHWQMIVTGAKQCAISIIEGANEPVVDFINYEPEYGKELFARASAFMLCVQTMTPPVEIAPVLPPVNAVKTYDMTGHNGWASEAYTWITTRQPAKDNAAAEKAIKALVPDDAILCHGHGIQIKRNRAGSLSLRELPQ